MNLTNAKLIASNVNPASYHGNVHPRGHPQFVMSRSELMEFAACPHRWLKGFRDEGTDSTEWGSLIDCMALQPSMFEERYAVTPEHYPAAKGDHKPWNRSATYCQQWEQDQLGKETVKFQTYKKALLAVTALKTDPDAYELIDCSEVSVHLTAEYHDEETGVIVPLRALVDMVPDKHSSKFGKSLADFKTAASAARREWPRKVFSYHYEAQAALYLDMYNAATGEDRNVWFHLIQENVAPYQVGRRYLSDDFIAMGRDRYTNALVKYSRCIKSGEFPGYDDSPSIVPGFSICEPEPWMLTAEWPSAPQMRASEPAWMSGDKAV